VDVRTALALLSLKFLSEVTTFGRSLATSRVLNLAFSLPLVAPRDLVLALRRCGVMAYVFP